MYTDLYCHKMLLKSEKIPSVFTFIRKILGALFLLVSALAVILAVYATRKFFAVLLAIVFFTAAVPIIIMDGTCIVLWQKHIVCIRKKARASRKSRQKEAIRGVRQNVFLPLAFPLRHFRNTGRSFMDSRAAAASAYECAYLRALGAYLACIRIFAKKILAPSHARAYRAFRRGDNIQSVYGVLTKKIILYITKNSFGFIIRGFFRGSIGNC